MNNLGEGKIPDTWLPDFSCQIIPREKPLCRGYGFANIHDIMLKIISG